MGFQKKIKYFLVHQAGLTNRQAQEAIDAGDVKVAGKTITENILIKESDSVELRGIVLRIPKQFVYYRFNKPKGYQSTLNEAVPGNLSGFFSEKDLSIAGRLDQQSEGLLLLSNDGKWVEEICNPLYQKEKEYLVELDGEIDEIFLETFRNGVILGNGYKTLPCLCEKLQNNWIKVQLTEGKNRQIRRMCYRLGRQVKQLIRQRINEFYLEPLEVGEKESILNI